VKLRLIVVSTAALIGCHSPGPYGHAAHYAALPEEAAASQDTREYDPVMFARHPDEWRKAPVSLFGVVESRAPGAGGAALLKLSVRRLEPRNLCENDKDEETCRVTVSDRDFGVVYVLARLPGEDDTGPRAVGTKSLLRVVGRIGEDVSPTDGAPILRATYYRHWPQYTYVTKPVRP
jgi:hypothetical protein